MSRGTSSELARACNAAAAFTALSAVSTSRRAARRSCHSTSFISGLARPEPRILISPFDLRHHGLAGVVREDWPQPVKLGSIEPFRDACAHAYVLRKMFEKTTGNGIHGVAIASVPTPLRV